MLNSSYNSLSRSPSTLNSSNRPTPSPKCFGRNTHILKEEYERERLRWQQKLDDSEQKLNEAAINNSELFQIKAELNRKIIDFEKNQRPLIEQNRRLNERIRGLNSETKKLEEKLSYAQDDFLSLRDAYDRLMKENSMLKEQRSFPEKLEELIRYRNQVLEYSKCITALRQSAMEKDRRHDLLVQKFKKYRKTLAAKRQGGSLGDEDDRHSYIGSEGSIDDTNSIGLDTIAEDLDEDVELVNALLSHPPMTSSEYSLKQQLDLANMTIIELQNTMENGNCEASNKFDSSMKRLKDEVKNLKEHQRNLEQELANSQEQNDLLEFQLVELTEGFQKKHIDFSDKQCSTNLELSTTEESNNDDIDLKNRINVTPEFVMQTRELLFSLIASCPSLFKRTDKDAIRNGVEVIDSLQNQLAFAETELNMLNCELDRLKRQYEDELHELQEANAETTTKKQQKKKELLTEIEQLKKEKKEDAKKSAKQIEEIMNQMQIQAKEIEEKSEIIKQLNSEIHLQKSELENQISLGAQFEKLIEELKESLEKSHEELLARKAEGEILMERMNLRQQNFEEIKQQLNIAQQLNTEYENRISELIEHNNTLKNASNEFENSLTQLQLNFKDFGEKSENEARLLKAKLAELELIKIELKSEKEQLEQELQNAQAQTQLLREQIRPIGTQLERRYEEARYRLSESLKKSYDLEESLNLANKRIAQLELEKHYPDDVQQYIQKIQKLEQNLAECTASNLQLQTFNHELEEQFNSQMDIISALKKKFIACKGNAKSTDSIGWTSNSSEGTNSLDDEQYHSEGSDTGRSLKAN